MAMVSNLIQNIQSKFEYGDEEEFEDPESEIQTDAVTQTNSENTAVQSKRDGPIIAFMSGKGGVGKTSIAVNVANYYAENGERVLLVDCDVNTKGATTFFRERKSIRTTFQEQFSYLSFHRMFSLVKPNHIMQGDQSVSNSIMRIKENFYFIPASLGDGRFDEQDLTDEVWSKIEEQFFDNWRKEFDRIILDLGAGGGPINIKLADFSDKICIVMQPNQLSKQAVLSQLNFVFSEQNLEKNVCCINKMNRDKRIDRAYSLFSEFPGFVDSNDYSRLFDAGRMITDSCGDLYIRLSEIAKTVYDDEQNWEIASDEVEWVKNHFPLLLSVIILGALLLCLSMAIVWYTGLWDKTPWWGYALGIIVLASTELFGLWKLYKVLKKIW